MQMVTVVPDKAGLLQSMRFPACVQQLAVIFLRGGALNVLLLQHPVSRTS